MAPLARALPLILLSGCANPAGPENKPRDFSLVMPDLAFEGDLASAENDLASGGQDLAESRDMAVAPPDLTSGGGGGACDLGAPGDAGMPGLLWFAGRAAGNTLQVARFHPSSGWSTATVVSPFQVSEVALAMVRGRPLLVQKRIDDKVDSSWWEPCLDTFPAPAQIFANALSLNRPSVVGGSDGEIVFRGSFMTDQRLYHSKASGGGAWSAPFAQTNLLTTQHPAAVRLSDGLHVIHVASNLKLYDGTVLDSGSGGSGTQIGGNGDLTAHPPSAVVDGSGALHVVWTNSPDKALMWFRRTSTGTITGPQALCTGVASCVMTSDDGPALALDAAGVPIASFTGTDENVYFSRLSGSTWSAPVSASGACGLACNSTLGPALATGVGGAEAELVFVRDSDGKAAHARLVGGVWQAAAAFTAQNFLNTPSLATLP